MLILEKTGHKRRKNKMFIVGILAALGIVVVALKAKGLL